jgi:hypothetical protein
MITVWCRQIGEPSLEFLYFKQRLSFKAWVASLDDESQILEIRGQI